MTPGQLKISENFQKWSVSFPLLTILSSVLKFYMSSSLTLNMNHPNDTGIHTVYATHPSVT